jgi:hypothetical protein
MAHGALDVVGLVPGAGEVADGLNGLWYLGEGDYLSAGLSFAGMVPFLGWGATAGKGAKALDDVAAGTPLFRGVTEGHHAYDDALRGEAWPGNVIGHSDGVLHARGWTHDSALTSWTTDRSIAEGFARKGPTGSGVILRTTLEEQVHRVVPGPNDLGESEVLLRGLVRCAVERC